MPDRQAEGPEEFRRSVIRFQSFLPGGRLQFKTLNWPPATPELLSE